MSSLSEKGGEKGAEKGEEVCLHLKVREEGDLQIHITARSPCQGLTRIVFKEIRHQQHLEPAAIFGEQGAGGELQ